MRFDPVAQNRLLEKWSVKNCCQRVSRVWRLPRGSYARPWRRARCRRRRTGDSGQGAFFAGSNALPIVNSDLHWIAVRAFGGARLRRRSERALNRCSGPIARRSAARPSGWYQSAFFTILTSGPNRLRRQRESNPRLCREWESLLSALLPPGSGRGPRASLPLRQ